MSLGSPDVATLSEGVVGTEITRAIERLEAHKLDLPTDTAARINLAIEVLEQPPLQREEPTGTGRPWSFTR